MKWILEDGRLVARGTNPVIRELELSALPLLSEKGIGQEIELITSDSDVISYAYVMESL